jgi:predicted CopG family antitoxin
MRTTITVPDELYEKVQKRFPDEKFSHVVNRGLDWSVQQAAAAKLLTYFGGKFKDSDFRPVPRRRWVNGELVQVIPGQ